MKWTAKGLVAATIFGSAAAHAKTQPPPCGILPTSTSCSVQVGTDMFEETAFGCDSPLPELRRQLYAAGTPDIGNLTASCTVYQPFQERSYTVKLGDDQGVSEHEQ